MVSVSTNGRLKQPPRRRVRAYQVSEIIKNAKNEAVLLLREIGPRDHHPAGGGVAETSTTFNLVEKQLSTALKLLMDGTYAIMVATPTKGAETLQKEAVRDYSKSRSRKNRKNFCWRAGGSIR